MPLERHDLDLSKSSIYLSKLLVPNDSKNTNGRVIVQKSLKC